VVRFASLAVLMSVALTTQVYSAEWRYCLARVPVSHKLMLSRIGYTKLSIADAERAFSRVLDEAGIQHDAVLCPRADDEASLATAQAEAIKYNELDHYAPSGVDWSP
jgi:hypothetical protein